MRLRPEAVVLDLVYAPAESVLLKHARWTGHAVVNGEPVLIAQAVEALLRLCGPLLSGRADVRKVVRGAMYAAAGSRQTA
jgi:shikimate 5-dehydrogenase